MGPKMVHDQPKHPIDYINHQFYATTATTTDI